MKVRDFMKTDVIKIETKTSIMDAQNIIRITVKDLEKKGFMVTDVN